MANERKFGTLWCSLIFDAENEDIFTQLSEAAVYTWPFWIITSSPYRMCRPKWYTNLHTWILYQQLHWAIASLIVLHFSSWLSSRVCICVSFRLCVCVCARVCAESKQFPHEHHRFDSVAFNATVFESCLYLLAFWFSNFLAVTWLFVCALTYIVSFIVCHCVTMQQITKLSIL